MATSTLLQKLDPVTDPLVSGTVGSTSTTMDRGQYETFIASETLVVGDWVAFNYAATNAADVTLGVFKADGNSSPVRTPFGVVVGADSTTGLLTAGSRVKVCIAGVCSAFVGDNAGAGNAIGTLLQITNTAGAADLASAASAQPVCGVLAEVVGAGAGVTLKRVVVIKQF
jgi:hypothetical protein